MRKIRLLIALLFLHLLLNAQNTIGLPEIINYPKQVYKAGTQNWDITQDRTGIIYFANNEGLLSFDGTYWKLHPLPNKTIVRSATVAPDNNIYVGGQNEIGYFSPDKNGGLVYHSIKDLIPEQHRSFADVWDIVCVEGSIFFLATQKIFQLHLNKIVAYPAGNWLFLGTVHNKVIAQEYTQGFLEFTGGHWTPINNKSFWPDGFLVTSVQSMGKDSILIATLKNGLYLYTAKEIKKIESPALAIIEDYHIYNAAIIDNDRIALATTSQGCIIIDKRGNLVQMFSRTDGLSKNNVLAVFPDKNKNLWLGLDNGIAFIAYDSPIKNIFPDKENEGAGYSAILHDNIMYLATTNGVYSVPIYEKEDISFVKGKFEPIVHAKGQVWNLSEVNGELFLGHHEGAFQVKKNVATQIDNSSGYWGFLPLSPILPSRYMVGGTYNGIKFFDRDANSFSRIPELDANFESSRFVTILDSAIWVSHPYKGVFRVNWRQGQMPEVIAYSESHGLSLSINGNYIFKIKNRLVVATEKGIYEYHAQKDRFEPSSYFESIFGKKIIRYMKEDKAGNIWFVFEKNLGVVDFSQPSPRIIYIPELNTKMVSGFEQVYPVDDNNIFIGAEKGFFHINYKKYRQSNTPITVQLSEIRVTGKTDSLLFGGFLPPGNNQSSPPTISYKWNSFHFQFSSPFFEHQGNIEYSYHLKGYDKKWSEWADKTEKEYTYLPAGSYSFEVKARTNLGNESLPFSYEFVILPPWYLSVWAFAFYIILLAYGGYLLYRWQKTKFIRQRQQYEEEQKRLQYLHQLELEKNEKEIIALRNENLEAEIQYKNKEMASATMHLVKKGELITKMKDELQRLTKNTESEESLDAVKKMIKSLSEDDKMDKDWEHFTVHFDKVNNDFFVALKEKHTNLTANEMKLCAYLRMNLSTKEVAQLMNISVRGVEISRYRLRKKLQISKEVNLFTYLLDFHAAKTTSSRENPIV